VEGEGGGRGGGDVAKTRGESERTGELTLVRRIKGDKSGDWQVYPIKRHLQDRSDPVEELL